MCKFQLEIIRDADGNHDNDDNNDNADDNDNNDDNDNDDNNDNNGAPVYVLPFLFPLHFCHAISIKS